MKVTIHENDQSIYENIFVSEYISQTFSYLEKLNSKYNTRNEKNHMS